MAENQKITTEPYKGVRDFYPQDMFLQHYIFSIWRASAELFGYVEYNASILEPAELYRAKSGSEIVNEQTYTFVDRGGREVTLRPEMTPTVARMIAHSRREISFPIRWYSIPNVFRYERPQRGRLREHFQFNCDLFGLSGIEADLEMMSLAHKVMKKFGAHESDFEIRISHRGLLNSTCDKVGLTPEQTLAFQKLLDRKDKIDTAVFETEASRIFGDDRVAQGILEEIEALLIPDDTITQLLTACKERDIKNVSFDKYLVRGFDYYTGLVFEVYDTHPDNRRALFGGGRYDGLTSLFEGGDTASIPAIGFGMGDVTIADFLETHGLTPSYKNPTQLTIILAGAEGLSYAEECASQLRNEGINVALDYSGCYGKKIGDQIKKAVKEGILYAIVIGANEKNATEITIKRLTDQTEIKVSKDGLVTFFKNLEQ